MNRGDICDVDWPGVGDRPAVIISRQTAIPVLSSITVALVTSTVRNIPAEVPVGQAHGLDHDSVINCDALVTIPKDAFRRYRGRLGPEELYRLRGALMKALSLDTVI